MTIRNIKCEGTPADLTPTEWLLKLLRLAVEKTRFKAEFSLVEKARTQINIAGVRLRENKHYCGNHPNACERGAGGGRPRRGAWLEGADWVEFDDFINDVCDEHYVDCDFLSRDGRGKKWTLRNGRMRRTVYDSAYLNGPNRNAEWVADEALVNFEDHFGATGVPASTFPEGTPGIHTKAGYAEADHH